MTESTPVDWELARTLAYEAGRAAAGGVEDAAPPDSLGRRILQPRTIVSFAIAAFTVLAAGLPRALGASWRAAPASRSA